MDNLKSSRLIMALIVSLAVVVMMVSGCGKEGGSVVGKEPIRNIARVEGNAQTLRTWIQSEAEADVLVHIDLSEDIRVFPGELKESMKNAADHIRHGNAGVVDQIAQLIKSGGHVNLACRGGLYDRVFWVIPYPKAPGEISLDSFKKALMSMRGYRKEDLKDLHIDGRQVTGKLGSVPITITHLGDLDIGESTAILHIDLSYFWGMKAAIPDYKPGTNSLIEMLRVLADKNIKVNFVTIDFSSLDKKMPIDMRYLGEIIFDALIEPSRLKEPLSDKWRMMIEAEEFLVSGEYGKAAKIYEKLNGLYLGDPGLLFSKGVTYAFLKRGDESRGALLRAYALDPVYLKGIFQLVQLLGINGEVETGEDIIGAEEMSRITSSNELNYQKGLFYLNAKENRKAVTYLNMAIKGKRRIKSILTLLYNAYDNLGDSGMMLQTLERLIQTDEKTVIREMPWVYLRLGELYEEKSQYRKAVDAYERYIGVVSSDSLKSEVQGEIRSLKSKYEK